MKPVHQVFGLLKPRFAALLFFGAAFACVSLALRLVLLAHSAASIDLGLGSLARTFGVGLFYDVVTFFYCMAPVAAFLLVFPERLYRSRLYRGAAFGLYFLALYILMFDAAAEYFFWDEFGCRFNFLAVDYLVYTRELVGNIWESYPVAPILAAVGAVCGIIVFLTRRPFAQAVNVASSFRQRLAPAALFLAIPALSLLLVSQDTAGVPGNQFMDELSKNGLHSLFAAFRQNTIGYRQFYQARDDAAAFARLKELIRTDNGRFVSDDPYELARDMAASGPERRCNVVFVVMESLSASFLKEFGNQDGITPNLDALIPESLFFRNFYATGTRTDRGLEAVTLSLPPTPGRSEVKRPDNGGLFSIGPIFRDRGYELKFIYGGFGYFDNMNAFFEGNAFTPVDRNCFARDQITFSNIWGVCDEDLYARTLKECDASHAAGKPFCSLVLTTSNHRPYTYPRKIDIPSGSGRPGAVKYADHAIGEFLRQARGKPWFDNTLFVLLADHCAGIAGKTEVPVDKYHIPLWVYAPSLIPPRQVDKLAGQIDLAPTVLGLLNFSYRSRFFGRDILGEGAGRAFVGNYQKIGLLEGDRLCLLLPRKQVHAYQIEQGKGQIPCTSDERLLADAISYYQTAAYLLAHHLYVPAPEPRPSPSRSP